MKHSTKSSIETNIQLKRATTEPIVGRPLLAQTRSRIPSPNSVKLRRRVEERSIKRRKSILF